MKSSTKQEELIICKSQLMSAFYDGIKSKDTFKIGVEFEKIGINSNDFKAVSYSGNKGMLAFFKKYKNYEKLNYLTENENILGLTGYSGVISLEPGSQLEISCYPQKTIHDIAEQLKNYNYTTSYLADDLDICWLGYGIQPLSTCSDIELIPKKRYDIMTDYLPPKGGKALVMMRETAGIQTSLDYCSEEDACAKLKVSLGISPIITAIFANSPIRGGGETGYKSFRALSWLNTDEERCGLVSRKIFEQDFAFKNYVDTLLDLSMIFIEKNGKFISMKGMSFRTYLENGYDGYKATINDWELHKNLYFPDTRLNSYLEIRNCDCQGTDLIPAVPALWKGIMYNNDALLAAWALVKDFSWQERQELRRLVPKYALDTVLNKIKVSDIAKELVNIAEDSLKSMSELNKNAQDESVYLSNLKELLNKNQSPADKILNFWQNDWNKDMGKLVDYIKLSK